MTCHFSVLIHYELYYGFRRFIAATSIVKYRNKEKWMHSGYGITFNSLGSCSFGNDIAGNVLTFGFDNSSSFHADNVKNIFLVLR